MTAKFKKGWFFLCGVDRISNVKWWLMDRRRPLIKPAVLFLEQGLDVVRYSLLLPLVLDEDLERLHRSFLSLVVELSLNQEWRWRGLNECPARASRVLTVELS